MVRKDLMSRGLVTSTECTPQLLNPRLLMVQQKMWKQK